MRILVTGFTGYVGSAASATLAARQHTVVALARSDAEAERASALGYSAVRGELGDAARYVRDVDGVLHAAASQRPEFGPLNTKTVASILAELGEDRAFVMQGGTGVFGDTGSAIFDGTEPPRPPPLLASASAIEQAVLGSSAPAYVAYAPLVHGGAGAMIPNVLVAAAKASGTGQYPAAGDNRWSTVHIGDWADLIARLLEQRPRGHRAYVGASGEVTMREVAAAVCAAIGVTTPPVSLAPDEASHAWGFFAPLLASNQRFSGKRAADAVGWKPVGPGLAAELAELAAAQ